MDLLATHRKIERRKVAELKAQLSQRDAVLIALLRKVGPVELSADEMFESVGGRVKCAPVGGGVRIGVEVLENGGVKC